MPKKRMRIVHISSEIEPFSRSGGLAGVASSLPKAHKQLEHDVVIITPLYNKIIDKKKYDLKMVLDKEKIELTKDVFYEANFFKTVLPCGALIYFVENKKLFGKQKYLYKSNNENLKYLFFDLATLHLLKKLKWKPDVLHCHDWHTGLIPYFLKGRFKKDKFWKNVGVLFTIHNLVFQFGHDWWTIETGKKDFGRSILPSANDSKKIERVNFAKRAILNADAINTVSETHKEEIMTKKYGEDLHVILKNREKIVFGIINGIDYSEYNPATDPGLLKRYNYETIENKKINKQKIQKYYNLKEDPDTPLICMTSRITEQKGFKLLEEIMEPLMRLNVQLIIMGNGDKNIINSLDKLKKDNSKKIAVVPFDIKMETSIYAGSDLFLLPSRFEPCGINQMISLRYGCVPIVHHIGGLADTVVNFNPITNKGNGFNFKKYDSYDFFGAIVRALETYKYKDVWKNLIINGMREANSWKIPAQKYIDLYKTTIKLKKGWESNNK